MKFIDWFAGIGGFRCGMERAGHERVGFCEFDKYAVASYTAMHLLTDAQREYIQSVPMPLKKNGEPNLRDRQKEILKEEYRNGNGMQMTLEEWMPEACPEQTAGVSVFHARTSQSQETALGSQESVQACFSQLQDLLETSRKKIDPLTYSLRTLRTYLVLIEGLTSPNFSLSWTRSGMMRNGTCSTVSTSGCRRTGSECSLLDILEEDVPEKYFLSEKQTEYITQPKRMKKYTKLHNA